MALNDIEFYDAALAGTIGDVKYQVAASATLIYPGEPVYKALGAAVVSPLATNKPVVATDYMAGIATSTSTNDASNAGYVYVKPLVPGMKYLISPKVAATWNTQAEYDLLVGYRVLLDLTSGSYTILAADGSTYGCVIEQMDVTKHPGKICFSFRAGVSYLA